MKLKIRKVIQQIRAQKFGQVPLSQFPVPDPGDRRRAHAPLCIR